MSENEHKQMLDAVKTGDMQELRRLLEFRACGHEVMDDLLSEAAQRGSLEAVELLLQRGGDPFTAHGVPYILASIGEHGAVAALLQDRMSHEKEVFLADMATQLDLKTWLRKPYRGTNEVPLVRAVKIGCFDLLAKKMIAAGEGLTLPDLLQFREHENKHSLLWLFTRSVQMPQMFEPKLWRGRLQEMMQAWNAIPEDSKVLHDTDGKHRSVIDFSAVVREHRMMTLREKQPKIKMLKP
jgi:hypothetical protein